ncbi:MAG: RNA polymerase factor sigma-54 [Pseudomonadota bacterium]
MAMSAKLEMRQGQQLVMTPQLQQAIRLLQLSNIELTAFVDAELERNPLLERDDHDETRDAREDAGNDATAATEDAGNADDWLDLRKETADASQALDTDVDNVYPDASPVDLSAPSVPSLNGGATPSRAYSDGDSNLESYVSSEVSLKDHLLSQVQMLLSCPAERLIGQYLVDFVDEAGYLRADTVELAGRLGTDTQAIEQVITKIQSCDPAGVFARTLVECLSLQLAEKNRLDPVMSAFLENLDRLANHDIAGLRKALGADAEDIAEMITEVRALDPKPGLRFGSSPVQAIVPDVMVRAAKDGSWLVELNSETLPRVLVDRVYYTTVSKSTRTEDDKVYLLDCLQTANWLVKSLDQRARTILRVAEEIVRQQDGFFTHGVQHLRPLNLRTVADAISMHESTISRVTSNKYMATPRGIFELKYFFTSAIASAEDNGDAYSSEAVRHRIKSLIDAETASGVLSDDKLVEQLKADGIDIARRTVAKYREAMHIPSSIQRRRQKKLIEQMANA